MTRLSLQKTRPRPPARAVAPDRVQQGLEDAWPADRQIQSEPHRHDLYLAPLDGDGFARDHDVLRSRRQREPGGAVDRVTLPVDVEGPVRTSERRSGRPPASRRSAVAAWVPLEPFSSWSGSGRASTAVIRDRHCCPLCITVCCGTCRVRRPGTRSRDPSRGLLGVAHDRHRYGPQAVLPTCRQP